MVEFCDNPKTTSHISTWRGEKDQTAASLLIQLWRQEELDLGIKRDHYGRIVGKFYDACETLSSSNERSKTKMVFHFVVRILMKVNYNIYSSML